MTPEPNVRVTVKFRNARILRRIEAMGFKSLAQFAHKYRLDYQRLSRIVALQKSPLLKNGDWLPLAWFVSSALNCEPEELWPQWLKVIEAKKSTVTFDTCMPEQLTYEPSEFDQLAVILPQLLLRCTPRQESAIRSYFYDNATLEEIGSDLGVNRERVRQIISKALRTMNWHARRMKLTNTSRTLSAFAAKSDPCAGRVP